MTTNSALVRRFSFCRKRIMDGLEPSTLFARASEACPPATSHAGLQGKASSRDAQISLDAILSHYRRPEAAKGRAGSRPAELSEGSIKWALLKKGRASTWMDARSVLCRVC